MTVISGSDTGPPITDRYRLVDFATMLEAVRNTRRVGFDTEWNPFTETFDLDFHIHGASFAVNIGETVLAIYLTEHDEIQQLLTIISEQEIEVVAHYAQAEHRSLLGSKFHLPKDLKYRDTSIALNKLDEERMENRIGLKKITPEFLKWELSSFNADDMDSDEFKKYGAEDAVAALLLYDRVFLPALVKYNLYDNFVDVCNSIQPFGDMSQCGMEYDLSVAEDQYEKILTLRSGIEQEIFKKIGRVNLKSAKQLYQRLFEELGYSKVGLDASKKTGKIGTGVKNMTKLAERYPVCELILAHRTANKMIGSMLEPWASAVTLASDGRIHPRYSFISKTGRTRCLKPNVQQIPKKLGKNIKFNKPLKAYFADLRMRKGFIAPDGYDIIICDYASAEYRLAAIAAQESKLVDLYCGWECQHCGTKGYDNKVVKLCSSCGLFVNQGGDLHQRNCDIANAAGASITRDMAKAVSFLAIFGGGAWKLSKDLNLPIDVCEQILNDVLDEFPGIRKWHLETARIADSTGEVRDIFGNRRKINLKKLLKREPNPEKHKGIRKNVINMLTNFPCQSPVSTICQLGFQNIRQVFINEKTWMKAIFPMIMVHDSLGFYCRKELSEEYRLRIVENMETAVEIAVPMAVDSKVCRNLNEDTE